MKRLIVGALTLATLLVPATAADAQAQVPLSPANGQVFAWEDVENSGIRLVAQAPPGLSSIEADVSRDPGLVSFADYVSLYEEAPGRYEGTALQFLSDPQSDPGPYYWQPYYYGSDPNTFEETRIAGPVSSFTIKPPYRAPVLRLSIQRRLFVGARYDLGLRYSPGSEPSADRLHLLATTRARCPSEPAPGAGESIVSDAGPPADAQIEAPIRFGRLRTVRLCGFVTSGGDVTARVGRRVDVVRRPVTRRQMLRWRLSARGLGPIRVGMTMEEIERVTGRTAVWGYGDYSSCQQWSLRGAPGLSLMRSYGRLARVAAYRGRWRSSHGIRIGDTERKVRRRYGVVRSEPHPYVSPGKYLIVGGPRYRMIFETSPGGRVTSFRGGRARQVGYIEGCA